MQKYENVVAKNRIVAVKLCCTFAENFCIMYNGIINIDWMLSVLLYCTTLFVSSHRFLNAEATRRWMGLTLIAGIMRDEPENEQLRQGETPEQGEALPP